MRFLREFNRFYMVFITGAMIVMAQQKISVAATCPCDIYSSAGTPCVAAYSTVRLLYSTYTGPLYQVRITSNNATKDIYPISGGTIADAASQDAFLGSNAGTFSRIYDQSGRGNTLPHAPAGCYSGTASLADNESNAKAHSFYIGGHKAYALYMNAVEGYRNNACNGVPTGTAAQGAYEVCDGTHWGGACCWDFGNVETNNCADGTGSMNTIFFGTGYWGKGAGSGPWFGGDFEAGIWTGGAGGYSTNNSDPSMTMPYAFGIVKTNTGPAYCIRVANAQSGNLTNVWDGNFGNTWKMGGAIVLGTGGDNSNSSYGTFYEGVVTSGRPSNATDSLVLRNVQAAGYGSSTSGVFFSSAEDAARTPLFKVSYNPSRANAVISYTLQDTRRVSMNIVDERGRQVAAIVNGIMSAGKHEAVWNAKRVPAGVYICRMAIEGREGATEKIIVGK
jgi:hypothetical protein